MTQGIGAYPSSKTESVKLELLCSCESYGIIHGPESYGIIHGPESYGIIHGQRPWCAIIALPFFLFYTGVC